MTTPFFPEELPVDDEILDELTKQACFAADNAYFDHVKDISRIKAPNGDSQGLTGGEITEIQVRAAIRNLLANGLIVARSDEERAEIYRNGTTVR